MAVAESATDHERPLSTAQGEATSRDAVHTPRSAPTAGRHVQFYWQKHARLLQSGTCWSVQNAATTAYKQTMHAGGDRHGNFVCSSQAIWSFTHTRRHRETADLRSASAARSRQSRPPGAGSRAWAPTDR